MRIKSYLREYELYFIDELVATLGEKHTGKEIYFIDQNIFEIYSDKLRIYLEDKSYFLLKADEKNKSYNLIERTIDGLINKKVRKNSNLVAIGGGIIQDITSFIASILFRGIRWDFYPTTLLAQADSCIGSKTSVNFGKYKNLLGGFYPPQNIYIDTNFLKTLPPEDVKSGIGEMLHFFFIDDSFYAERLFSDYQLLIEGSDILSDYIWESLSIKKRMVEKDEFDKGERNIFNYGHTFGHAIETISNFDVSHGRAVTVGMDLANYISLKLGMIDENTFNSMREILKLNKPEYSVNESNIETYLDALTKDKKNTNDKLTCILTRGPGKMEKTTVPFNSELRSIIIEYFQKYQ